MVVNGEVTKQGKDIDFGYSLTTHKSQGGTFNTGFVDLGDIIYYTDKFGKKRMYEDIDMIRRLIYVAISRTRTINYLVL